MDGDPEQLILLILRGRVILGCRLARRSVHGRSLALASPTRERGTRDQPNQPNLGLRLWRDSAVLGSQREVGYFIFYRERGCR
jgi:hypothetical protein